MRYDQSLQDKPCGGKEINVSSKTKYKFKINARKIFTKQPWMHKLTDRGDVADGQGFPDCNSGEFPEQGV